MSMARVVLGQNAGAIISVFSKTRLMLSNSTKVGEMLSLALVKNAAASTGPTTFNITTCFISRRRTTWFFVPIWRRGLHLSNRPLLQSHPLTLARFRNTPSPFTPAAAVPRPPLAASSVPNGDTSPYPTPAIKPNPQTVNLSGLLSQAKDSAPQKAKISAYPTTSPVNLDVKDQLHMVSTVCMPALSVVHGPITLSPGPASPTPLEEFLLAATPPRLSYPSFKSSIIRRPLFDPSLHSRPEIFDAIVQPYNADIFEQFLIKHNLFTSYPELVHNLRHGFPLGHMPDLTSTIIIPNHPSTTSDPRHIDAIEKYLDEETSSGRMSGPFSQEETEQILRGPFKSSPLIISVQGQAPGEPDKIRICRHLSKSFKSAPSVNSFISKWDFPTRFDTACRVADIVSS
jgi:hypothetical protein